MRSTKSVARPLPFDLQADPVQEVVPNLLTFQWIFNRHAFILTARSSTRTVVDAWAAKILELARDWPPERTFLAINDFSHKDCMMTPYIREKNKELTRAYPHLRVASAAVLHNNITMQLSRFFVRTMQRDAYRVLLAFSLNEALIWLKAQHDEAQARLQQHTQP